MANPELCRAKREAMLAQLKTAQKKAHP